MTQARQDAQAYLESIADAPDESIHLAKAALSLAALDQSDINLQRYDHHLFLLVKETKEAFESRLNTGEVDSAKTRLSALADVLVVKHGYSGDNETYDDLQNANLIRVIERRKGLPIALAILYIHVGQAQGWDVAGLSIPGYFLCRIEHEGQRIIFDPFQQGQILQASDIRNILKRVQGEKAELSADYFIPALRRDILVRLQNNIKYRQIQMEDYKGGLETVRRMQAFCPADYRLLLEAGILYARTGQPVPAIRALEGYIAKAPDSRDREEAALLLSDIKSGLH